MVERVDLVGGEAIAMKTAVKTVPIETSTQEDQCELCLRPATRTAAMRGVHNRSDPNVKLCDTCTLEHDVPQDMIDRCKTDEDREVIETIRMYGWSTNSTTVARLRGWIP